LAFGHDEDSGMIIDDLRMQIHGMLQNAYLHDSLRALADRTRWLWVSDSTEALARFLAGVATVLSFASSTYSSDKLSFAAGCIGTIGMAINAFSMYGATEARERLARLNAVLRDVRLSQMSDTPPMTNHPT
jgi:hypothetical protein